MKTKAVRIYGVEDLRLEEFELPAIKDDEILAKVVSDSVCMSTYKLAEQGANHKRAPKDIDKNPTIVGHEFCGEIAMSIARTETTKSAANIGNNVSPKNLANPENLETLVNPEKTKPPELQTSRDRNGSINTTTTIVTGVAERVVTDQSRRRTTHLRKNEK